MILGAAVGPGGRPSAAMRRRVEHALEAAHGRDARFLVSGGVGRHPPSEAEVMCQILVAAGVRRERVRLEEHGVDTLSSVRHCTRILREAGATRDIVVCSDAYHLPRACLLFRALGLRVHRAPAPGAHAALGTRRWLVAVAREAVAIPLDLALALVRRLGPR